MSLLSTTEKAKLIVGSGVSAFTFNPLGAMMTYLDSELSRIPTKANIGGVLLHEIITGLSVSFGATELFQLFSEHIRERWHTVRLCKT